MTHVRPTSFVCDRWRFGNFRRSYAAQDVFDDDDDEQGSAAENDEKCIHFALVTK